MTPVSWPLIASDMTAWLDQVTALPRLDPALPTSLAQLHSRFEQIHPFLDGNGRAGRLLLNLLLVRLGFPPSIIYKRQRADYLRALRRADGGDPGQLGELIARAILDNLYRFVVPAVAGPALLVPLGALASKETTADALRTAAVRGRLQSHPRARRPVAQLPQLGRRLPRPALPPNGGRKLMALPIPPWAGAPRAEGGRYQRRISAPWLFWHPGPARLEPGALALASTSALPGLRRTHRAGGKGDLVGSTALVCRGHPQTLARHASTDGWLRLPLFRSCA